MIRGMGIKLYMVIPTAFFIAVGATVLGYYFSEWVFLYLLLSVVFLIGLKFLFKRKIAVWAICLSWFFIFSFYSMDKSFDRSVLKEYDNKDIVAYCEIKGIESKNQYFSTYTAEITGISKDGKLITSKEKCELKLNSEDDLDFSYGDFVKVNAKASEISGIKNSGETDFSLFKKARGIAYSLEASMAERLSAFDKISDLEDLSYCLRSYIKTVCCDMLGEKSAALVVGILISDKSLLDVETREILESAGIMHICVASGMHVNCIMSAMAFLLAGFGAKRRYFLGFILPVILFYAFLNSWSSPIIRAGMGAVLFGISFNAKRDYDPFIALCFSGLVILLFSPLKLFDVGFLLSFSAVLALIFLKKDLAKIFLKEKTRKRRENRILKRILYYIKTTTLASVAVSLIVVPVCAYYFGYISPYSIVTNLMVSWILPYLFFSASAMIILWFIPIIGEVFAFFTEVAAQFILKVSEIIYRMPFSKVEAFVPFEVLLIIVFLVFFLHNLRKSKLVNRIGKVVSLTALVILVLGQAFSFLSGLDTVKVRFVNVGEGDGCIIKLSDGTGIVVDAGGSEFSSKDRTFVPYINRMNIKSIGYVFVSHFDQDHAKNILYVLDNFKVSNVILPKRDSDSKYKNLIENKAEEQGSDIVYVRAGDEFYIRDNIKAEFFAPVTENLSSENDGSVVMRIEFDGTSILFLGDIGEALQSSVARIYGDKLKSDIVKISHHGDYNSYNPLLIDCVKPKFAVISCGENERYSHPDDEVVKQLRKENIITYITNTDKDIKFNIDFKDSIREKYYERTF